MTLYLAARFLIKSERLLKNKAGVWFKKNIFFFISQQKGDNIKKFREEVSMENEMH